MSIYFCSDMHFNHKNIIQYCNRPFDSVEEMNNALIRIWNDIISDSDTVYHLGDFAFVNKHVEMFEYFVDQLNGKKIFIQGNHDRESVLKQVEAHGLIEYHGRQDHIVLDGRQVTLSHFPMMEWDGCYYDGVQLFGHIHDMYSDKECQEMWFNNTKHKSKNWFNVGIDNTNLKPLSWEQIIRRIEMRR